jgi:hypothetical protein
MRIFPCCVLIVHLAAGVAQAQTFNDLQIRLGAYNLSENGGEKPIGIWRSTGPVVLGKPVASTFSVGETCEAFAVSSDGSITDNATMVWKIELTPIRVVRDAVTFRLSWRTLGMLSGAGPGSGWDFGNTMRIPNKNIELTLRPGESWPVYTLRNISRYSCGGTASIRVSVDNYPWDEAERRLVAADLWLVERLANGTEAQRSQPLSVRGLPNRSVRFYFDSIADAKGSLDIYGILVARLEGGGMAVSVETRCRWDDPSHSGPQRSLESVVQVKPAETVEIRLPQLDASAGPFGNREFSIRIRARQLR